MKLVLIAFFSLFVLLSCKKNLGIERTQEVVTYTDVSIPISDSIVKFDILDENNILAISKNGSTIHLFKSSNSGESWSEIILPSEITIVSNINSLVYLSTNEFAIVVDGKFFRTYNNGSTWIKVETTTNQLSYHFAAKDETNRLYVLTKDFPSLSKIYISLPNSSNYYLVTSILVPPTITTGKYMFRKLFFFDQKNNDTTLFFYNTYTEVFDTLFSKIITAKPNDYSMYKGNTENIAIGVYNNGFLKTRIDDYLTNFDGKQHNQNIYSIDINSNNVVLAAGDRTLIKPIPYGYSTISYRECILESGQNFDKQFLCVKWIDNNQAFVSGINGLFYKLTL